MSLHDLLRGLRRRLTPSSKRSPSRRTARPTLECLEAREVPAILTVTNLADTGGGSLRRSIEIANALPGADEIQFDPRLVGTIHLSNNNGGLYPIIDDLTITGSGAARITLDGDDQLQIFSINNGTNTAIDVRISGLTLTGGNASGLSGGAITNNEFLTLEDVVVSNSRASVNGGGIVNLSLGSVTLSNCTVANNRARFGGGIHNSGVLVVGRSRIESNVAIGSFVEEGGGGGILNTGNLAVGSTTFFNNASLFAGGAGLENQGTATVGFTTFDTNESVQNGGAILNGATGFLEIVNSTMTGNTARRGAALDLIGDATIADCTISGNFVRLPGEGALHLTAVAAAELDNTIVANTLNTIDLTASLDLDLDNNGIIIGSHNLIEGFNNLGTLTNTIFADPNLDGLANNGGRTATLALLPGSPALNAGNNGLVPSRVDTDQRGEGFNRLVGTVDIGAFEVQNVAPTATISGPATGATGQALNYTGTFTDPNPDSHTLAWQVVDSGNQVVATGSGPTFSFTPPSAGTFNVVFTVTDDDGGVGTASLALAVTDATGVVLQVDDCDPTRTMIVVTGTSSNDAIQITPVGNNGSVRVEINGVDQGKFAPTGRVVVKGLAGDDVIQVAGGVTKSAWLYGGDGNDALKGGKGDDVLLGGSGNDDLQGGQGRDLLIGGVGADVLQGNQGDDILIAGFTAHDDSAAALCAIMAEWTRTNPTYAQRVAHLHNGGGLNGAVVLVAGTTVLDDGAADTVAGNAGTDLFFANLSGGVLDALTDLASGEIKDEL